MNILIILIMIFGGYALYRLGYADGKLQAEFDYAMDELDKLLSDLKVDKPKEA